MLESLSTSTEEEFLHIASRLKDIRDRTARISELATSIVGFVSGEVMVEAIKELNAMTEKASGCLRSSAVRVETSVAKLENIDHLINNVHERIEAMNRLTKNLYKLGFFTKIENSSLKKTEKGLESLGEDVRQLSESIIGKTRNISESTKSLTKAINASLSGIRGIGEKQQVETSAIIEATVTSISSLTEKYRLSAVVAEEVSSASEEMSGSIWDVVTSVQFHDIARQQFERSKRELEAVLRGVNDGFEGRSSEGRVRSVEEALRAVEQFCMSEPLQLRHTCSEFAAAIKSALKNLTSVSEKMREVLDKTRKITGADFSSGSFLIEIEDILSSVTSTISALSGDTTVMKELSEVITLSVSTVRDILRFADEIEEIGDDVGLLAINAAVTAQRMGDRGRPFSVIADSISRISAEARQHAGSISGTLKNVSAVAEELWKDTPVDGEAEIADTSAGLERLIGSLHTVNREMARAFNDIEGSERALSAEIEEIIAGTNIHARVEVSTGEIVSLMEETVSKLKAGWSGIASDKYAGRDLRGSDRRPEEALSATGLRTGSGEFGGNVELF